MKINWNASIKNVSLFLCFLGVEDMLIQSGIWNQVNIIVAYIFNIDYSNILTDVGWAFQYVIPMTVHPACHFSV